MGPVVDRCRLNRLHCLDSTDPLVDRRPDGLDTRSIQILLYSLAWFPHRSWMSYILSRVLASQVKYTRMITRGPLFEILPYPPTPRFRAPRIVPGKVLPFCQHE
jgi:hypothetical protein